MHEVPFVFSRSPLAHISLQSIMSKGSPILNAFTVILAADNQDIIPYRKEATWTAEKLRQVIFVESDLEDDSRSADCFNELLG